MLTLLYGENIEQRTRRRDELLLGNTAERYDSDTFSDDLAHQGFGATLFGETRYIVVQGLLSEAQTRHIIVDSARNLVQAPHLYILIEGQLPRKDYQFLEEAGATIEHFPRAPQQQSKPFSPFVFTQACAERNKKKAWLAYREAFRNNVSSDELLGLLWWQYKTIVLVAKSSGNPGLKPFVYQKTKKYSTRYRPDELMQYMRRLMELHRESRQTGHELEIGLEQFVLHL